MARMTVQELDRFLQEHFPQALGLGAIVEELGDGMARLRQPVGEAHLRPGGTISGPTLMTLADTAMFYAVLSAIGPAPLAVTTNLNINFLRRPAPADIVAVAELLKLGKRLAVGQVTLTCAGDPRPVAHATLTYSLPDPGRR